MDKAVVYFSNGCKAEFDIDKLNGFPFNLVNFFATDDSRILVNWDNVSFVRKKEREDDDE